MSEKRTTTGVVRSRAFSPSTTSNRSISRSGVPSGRTTTCPARLMPKYGLPHAVTWYRSSESSLSHAGLGANLFAGWSKSVAALRKWCLGARKIAEISRLFCNSSRRIFDPFAPRACVESRAAFAGVLHREQQVARRDAGTAHDNRVIVGDAVLRLRKTLAQFVGGSEAALAAEIGSERMIASTRDVARDRIDRLHLAAESFRCARVEQSPVVTAHALGDFTRVQPHVAVRSCGEVAGAVSRNLGGNRQAGCSPRLESAVENSNRLVSDPAQQPPQARRVRGIVGVVGDHLGRRRHAPARERGRKLLRLRQRMTSARRRDRRGEVPVEMGIKCMRNVPGGVGALATIRFAELEAAVDDQPTRVGYVRRQFCSRDQRPEACSHGNSLLTAPHRYNRARRTGLEAQPWHWKSGGAAAARIRGGRCSRSNTNSCRTTRTWFSSRSRSTRRRRS